MNWRLALDPYAVTFSSTSVMHTYRHTYKHTHTSTHTLNDNGNENVR